MLLNSGVLYLSRMKLYSLLPGIKQKVEKDKLDTIIVVFDYSLIHYFTYEFEFKSQFDTSYARLKITSMVALTEFYLTYRNKT
jgi:hypothetical protein